MEKTEAANVGSRAKLSTEPTAQSFGDCAPSLPSNQPTLPTELVSFILEALTSEVDFA